MKKLFSAVLGTAMVASLAATSFAVVDSSGNYPTTDWNEDHSELLDVGDFRLVGPLEYGSDSNTMKGGANLEYGDNIYWQIQVNPNPSGSHSWAALTDYSEIEDFKVKAEWEMGEEFVENISIVKKEVDGYSNVPGVDYIDANDNDEWDSGEAPLPGALALGNDVISRGEYTYFIEVSTTEIEATSDADLIGTLTFNKKDTDEANFEIDDMEWDIEANIFYENEWRDAYGDAKDLDVRNDIELEYDTYYAMKFDNDDEIEIEFGGENDGSNEGVFTVDISGQGKIVLWFDTDADEDIMANNPGATVKFVNFNNPTFNRTGVYAYEWEYGRYAYELIDGVLYEIPNLEFDESDETFYFPTRTLGSYVFSDIELLNAPIVTEPTVTPTPIDPSTPVTNPDTGAAL